MASKNRIGRGQNASRTGGKRRGFLFIALLAAITLAATVFVLFLKDQSTELPATPSTISPTTLWPYGQPEYSIEVPEGYEALLPAAELAVEAVPKTQKSNETNLEQKPLQPNQPVTKSAPKSSDRAEPYILTVRKRMEGKGIKPTLIIVIDDVGYNLDQLKPFLEMPFPISIAVLPQVDHSEEAASLAASAGKEVLLHQPMQALGGNNPGPGAILLGMDPKEVANLLAKNLDSLPQAVGVNNHMGSAVTRDESLMAAVLDLVKSRGIYYLDSLTAPGTATAALCRKFSIPYWERDVFLDNTGDKQSILHALDEGKKIASGRGASVLIGHVWSAELAQTLMDIYPQLVEEGYSLSTISKYMIQSAIGDNDARSGN